ncbi:MAG: DUF3127 domain-containing protein [Chitinophagales bacterium]|nr:DUF3127 domain-containing protein [Chitinophagales bacterium]
MQLIAKLIQSLPLQSGIGKNGEWKKQDIVVEIDGQYPKKVCISIWGDKINNDILQIGNLLKIDFDIESREFNSKWYTDVKAWKIEVADTPIPSTPINTDNMDDFIQMEEDDILPF